MIHDPHDRVWRKNPDGSAIHVNPDGEVWCEHRDVSCCPKCFNQNRYLVDVGSVVYFVNDDDELADWGRDPSPFVRMSPAYYQPPTTTEGGNTAMTTMISNHVEYRELLAKLDEGAHLGTAVHDAMVAFAKAKKMKQPPADNPAPQGPKPRKPATKKARTPKVRTTHRNVGQECSADGCDKPASSLGLCKAHHTAHWRSNPENREKSRRAARKHAAKKRYIALVTAIGRGFHPDTPGREYTSLPDGITPQQVDQVVGDALAYGLDVHGLALDVTRGADR